MTVLQGQESLLAGLAAWGMSLTEDQQTQFATYQELLLTWNKRLNLTAIDEPAAVQVRHFLDSLSCIQATGDLRAMRLIDVGTGAGFPGVPLKVFNPKLNLTLVESTHKKCQFLEIIVSELGLEGVKVLAQRAETVGQDPAHRESYDWAVARSVAAMPVLAEYLLPLCRIGGHMLAQKGEQAKQETVLAAEAIARLGGGRTEYIPVQLPGHHKRHFLVVVEKLAATPANFPRRPGLPAKRPLA